MSLEQEISSIVDSVVHPSAVAVGLPVAPAGLTTAFADDEPTSQSERDGINANDSSHFGGIEVHQQQQQHLTLQNRKLPGSGGQADATYLKKIHEMLEAAEKEGFQNVVSWLPNGRGFKIHKKQEFADKIMPRFFKAKIESFMRWLRAWGFSRVTEGNYRGSWYHRYFVRGLMEFCNTFTRVQMLESMEDFVPPEDFFETPIDQVEHLHVLSPTIADASQLLGSSKKLRGVVVEDLRQMLFDVEKNEEMNIVSWQSHGLAFKIHRKNEFEAQIIPRYFKTNKLTHFSDSLRLWGFRRLKGKGRDKGAYFHKFFARDQAFLSSKLSRQQMKDSMKDWPGAEGEPNLYSPKAALRQQIILANKAIRQQAIEKSNQTPLGATMAAAGPTDPIHFLNPPIDINPSQLQLQQQQHALSVTEDINLPSVQQSPANEILRNPPAGLGDGQNSKATNNDVSYVLKIHEMLGNAEKEGHTHIVSWQPHGRAFRIHKESEFETEVMPRYFKGKLASFRRWLRAWGFVRMTEGKDRGGWYHRYFCRGLTSLCKDLNRAQMKKAMEDWLPIGEAPDFYNYTFDAGDTRLLAMRESNPSINPKKLRGTILENLRDMLEEGDQESDPAASWLPHGCAFVVNDKKAFTENVLPKYFKAKKYTYFSDTLRIWGFVRLKKRGVDKGAYFHRYFIRGRPALSRHLSRKQMKESMAAWPPATGEPDLYLPDPEAIIQQCFGSPIQPVQVVPPAFPAQIPAATETQAKTSDISNTTWV